MVPLLFLEETPSGGVPRFLRCEMDLISSTPRVSRLELPAACAPAAASAAGSAAPAPGNRGAIGAIRARSLAYDKNSMREILTSTKKVPTKKQ